jgi:hypothetical protein
VTGDCLLCGGPGEDRHHPTGRGHDGRYLDPWFRAWLCHDDHELAHDDLRPAGLDSCPQSQTFLDRFAAAMRRLAAFVSRLAGGALDGFLSDLARWLSDRAEDLHSVIAALDAGLPGWRELPGMP